MKMSICLFVVLAMSISGVAATENSDARSRAKDLVGTLCMTCHGSNGVSVMEDFPNLAGQKPTYLKKQLRDFRDGNRKDPVMTNMAAPLDDEVIEALAEYFSTAPRN